MAGEREVQYVSDANGNPIGVIVPIELWREIESDAGNRLLAQERNDKGRLLEAKDRQRALEGRSSTRFGQERRLTSC